MKWRLPSAPQGSALLPAGGGEGQLPAGTPGGRGLGFGAPRSPSTYNSLAPRSPPRRAYPWSAGVYKSHLCLFQKARLLDRSTLSLHRKTSDREERMPVLLPLYYSQAQSCVIHTSMHTIQKPMGLVIQKSLRLTHRHRRARRGCATK